MKNRSRSRRIKESLSRFYLDCAEKLPEFRGTAIAMLQIIRDHQREDQKKAQDRTRAPEGTSLAYKRLLFSELFPIEDYDAMEVGLRRLFPEREFGRDALADFREVAFSLASSGSTTVGWLVREKRPLLPLPQRVMQELPVEFERGLVRVHKILPSAFVVTIEVFVDHALTDEVNRLQGGAYLPPVWFDSYIPWGSRVYKHAQGSAEVEIQRAVQRRLEDFRVAVEKVLFPYVSGYFAEQDLSNLRTVFPVVEILELKGTPLEPEKFSEWLARAFGWLESMGTTRMSISWFGFKDPQMLFVREYLGWNEDEAAPYRLFLLDRETNDTEKERLPFTIDDTLRAILPFMTLSEFLDRTEKSIERLRRKVYKRVQRQAGISSFGSNLRLNELIENESMLFARFDTELKQSEDSLAHEAHMLRRFHNIDNPDRSLADELPRRVRRQVEFLKPHLELSSRLFANYVSLKNLSANYRLQTWMLFWTIVVSLATLITLWPQIRCVLESWLR